MPTLFLEGDKFVGKSTLIKEVLQGYERHPAGFYVERRRNENQEVIAYELCAAASLYDAQIREEVVGEERNYFLTTDGNKRSRNLDVFQEMGVSLLRQALAAPEDQIVLLDEIGGVELLCESFTETLFQLLQRPGKVIGVFKSERNYQQQRRNSTQPLAIVHQRAKLIHQLYNTGDLITMTPSNRDEMKQRLVDFLEN